MTNARKYRFKIHKHGPGKFRWVMLNPNGVVVCSGPAPGKYLNSPGICRTRIATLKEVAAKVQIED